MRDARTLASAGPQPQLVRPELALGALGQRFVIGVAAAGDSRAPAMFRRLQSQGLASTTATLPSKSVVRTCVALSGTTVFMTPVPSLCSHLIAPVLASSAKSKSFLVP